MSELLEIPFFIVGAPRSGTTLLRFMLSSHPRLYIPSETGFLPYLSSYAKRELTLKGVRKILSLISSHNREWAPIVDRDALELLGSLPAPTLSHLLDALYRQRVAGQGADRWGDKTPAYVRYIPELNEIFPQAQFIHVIRDGRDAALSALEKWGSSRWYMDSYYLLTNWTEYIEQGREARDMLGQARYKELRYENLVEDPQESIQMLCDFLGEELHPDMLDHTQLAQKQIGNRGHVEVRGKIFTRSMQRWKEELSSFDLKLADRVAGSTLATFGYERQNPGALTFTERVRLLRFKLKYQFVNLLRTGLRKLGLLQINRGKRKIPQRQQMRA